MKKLIFSVLLLSVSLCSAYAQADRKEVRRGNSDYRRSNYKDAEIHYRKAAVQDSMSFAATYNLANTLYQLKDYEGAANTLSKIGSQAEESPYADRYYFNKGNVSLQKKDYKSAVEDFKQALLRDPSDMSAKESYTYAKKMLENEQNGGEGQGQNQDRQNQDQNQDQQNQDQNKDQDQQNQNQDQNQNQGQDQDRQDASQPQEQISKSQAQQMLKAIQAQEKETQEKVEKAKAEKAKTRQKDKNW